MKRALFLVFCLAAVFGYADSGLWVLEQDFVKLGKKEVYEKFKKDQEGGFAKRVGFSRFCFEDGHASQYLYFIPVQDFRGLSTFMEKRLNCHEQLAKGDKKEMLPFLSTVKFFIESIHRELPDCGFMSAGKESLSSWPYAFYFLYGILPGNGPLFEQQLHKLASAQEGSKTPVNFKTWRVVFGGDEPSYIVAIFAETAKEAKRLAENFPLIDGTMKNVLRQERKGEVVLRKDLSSVLGK